MSRSRTAYLGLRFVSLGHETVRVVANPIWWTRLVANSSLMHSKIATYSGRWGCERSDS
ncbi:hypothetical protein HSEST_0899 [Halapricum desulfuricans]|uniref:Uncharacterized protein n=1 Tax=Halapricum desulfuricans TaxID=2841257 RepID=A0A897NJ09_9EURY|nr:hypothetical protein HSEST_0899 [Halapricum desulfuricans]